MSKEKLGEMSDAELTEFHNWFFGDDREFMIEHIMEHSVDLEEEIGRFNRQRKNNENSDSQ